ncbi:hypothetical protein C8J57DRAFT_1714106 [Mycena rebaudengoi]|nr:hypothetical protein C8J57DRAFT_1714106 [Mycena rebaudengoi]
MIASNLSSNQSPTTMTTLCRKLIIYTPPNVYSPSASSQFSCPRLSKIGDLQKGEEYQNIERLLMYAILILDDDSQSEDDDDDSIPDLIPADSSPHLLTYCHHCINHRITLVKSKL